MFKLKLCIIQQFLKMEKMRCWTQEVQMNEPKEGEQRDEYGEEKQIKVEPLFSLNQSDQCFIHNSKHTHNQSKILTPQNALDRQNHWSEEQEKLLVNLHNQRGNRWVQIARQLQRSDNSVKNHYHSRLRKALRKINHCISNHFSPQSKILKINILSRVIQAAQGYYSENVTPQAAFAYKLKNDLLSFVDLSQQQFSQQQIDRVRKLFSQLNSLTHPNKKTDKMHPKDRNTANKYKGKEIISLLQENLLSQQRDRKKTKETQDEEDSILAHTQRQQGGNNQFLPSNSIGYNSFYFFNQPIYPIYFSIVDQTPPSIFSGKPSSFTYYSPQNEKGSEATWTSIPGETI